VKNLSEIPRGKDICSKEKGADRSKLAPFRFWWSRGELNPRPPECDSSESDLVTPGNQMISGGYFFWVYRQFRCFKVVFLILVKK
jgi:hypothetical protein